MTCPNPFFEVEHPAAFRPVTTYADPGRPDPVSVRCRACTRVVRVARVTGYRVELVEHKADG